MPRWAWWITDLSLILMVAASTRFSAVERS